MQGNPSWPLPASEVPWLWPPPHLHICPKSPVRENTGFLGQGLTYDLISTRLPVKTRLQRPILRPEGLGLHVCVCVEGGWDTFQP